MILATNNSKGSFGVPGAGVFQGGETKPVDMKAAVFCQDRQEFTLEFTDFTSLPYKDAAGNVEKVGFIGAVDSRFGYGSAAITILKALYSAGIETNVAALGARHIVDCPPEVMRQLEEREYIPKVEIIHATPDWWHLSRSPISIMWTMWETDQIPNLPGGPYGGRWLDHIPNVDAMVVPCPHNKRVFEACGVDKPIEVIPYAIDPEPWPYIDRPERDIFTVMLFGDLTTRKSPLETVEAFQRAFPVEKDVRLVLKTFANRFGGAGMQFAPQFVDSRIRIVNESWDRPRLLAELGNVDCGIWLSRGEGFGLPPAQMALTGLPVVMVHHTGMESYYDPKFFYGVDGGTEVPSPLGGNWIEPDVEEAAAQLRKVYDNRKEAKRRGKAARSYLLNKLSPEVFSSRLAEYLKQF